MLAYTTQMIVVSVLGGEFEPVKTQNGMWYSCLSFDDIWAYYVILLGLIFLPSRTVRRQRSALRH